MLSLMLNCNRYFDLFIFSDEKVVSNLTDFEPASEEEHSRLLLYEPKVVHLYHLKEGVTSETPTNKIPDMFKM